MSDFNPNPPIPSEPPPPGRQQQQPTPPPGHGWQQPGQPPGQGWQRPIPSAPPQPQAMLRSQGGLGTAILALLVIWCAAKVLGIFSLLGQARLLQGAISNPASLTEEQGAASDAFVGLTELLDGGLFVAAGIIFVIWLFRARANAEALSPLQHRRARGWLIAGWIVPIVNFWFPYQIMSDIWQASDPDTRQQRHRLAKAGQLGWWWATFLSYSLLSNAATRLIQNEIDKMNKGEITTLDGVRSAFQTVANGSYLLIAITPIGIAAAILCIRMVRKINELQEAPSTS